MKCTSGKRLFDSQEIAEEALVQNHIVNNYRANEGPKAVYLCDQCDHWHFTSKGEQSPILEDPEVKKRIQQERRAYQWERGLK